MFVIATTRNFIIETPYVKKTLAWPPAGVYSTFAWAYGSALAETCEDDLATLRLWFPSGAQFGSENPVRVVIEAFPPDAPGVSGPLGENWGYKTQGASKIQISPLWGAPNPAEALRSVFVHELSEILMTAQHPQRWIPTNSMGEALADVCQWLRHPEGSGPRAGDWLNYQVFSRPAGGLPRAAIVKDWHRPNWIDKTDNDETPGGGQLNAPAVACGILFIHYLRWLGSRIEEIIASGAPTFRQVLDNVTQGRDIGGSQEFFNLINLHFPEVPDPHYEVPSDDVFPFPSLVSLTLDRPSAVATGLEVVTGTVALDAPQKTTIVTLFSTRPDLAFVDSTVTIPLNETKVDFDVIVLPRADAFPPQLVQIWASYGGRSVAANLTVHSAVESTVGILKSITVSPQTVVAGAQSTGTVELMSPVSTDTVVGVAAAASGGGPGLPRGPRSDLVTAPSRVTVKANQPSEQFQIRTTSDSLAPHTKRTVTIAANAVVTKTATLTIEA